MKTNQNEKLSKLLNSKLMVVSNFKNTAEDVAAGIRIYATYPEILALITYLVV